MNGRLFCGTVPIYSRRKTKAAEEVLLWVLNLVSKEYHSRPIGQLLRRIIGHSSKPIYPTRKRDCSQ
jgi:hypothetical protein